MNDAEVDRGRASEMPGNVGSYVIVRRLGKGASSDVFEARDARSGVHRALKLFAGPQPGDGFVREAGVGLDLRHPNLVSAHDMGYLDSGTRYVAFDLVAGGSLRQRLGRQQSVAFVRHVIVELGRALGVLHAAGLVHRDVKPENVLLSSDDPFARVRLGDLGTCETVRHGAARGDVGSPAYMAPEQIDGACDTRADLYALGVVAYEMLAHVRPFVGSPKDVLEGHLGRTPSWELIPRQVQPVLARALAKQPDQRYAGVATFVAALDRALAELDESRAPRPAAVADSLELAHDRASGWTVRRSSSNHVAVTGCASLRNRLLELDGEGAADIAASGLVRAALRDGSSATFVMDGEPVVVASPLYGLPAVVAIRRLAGDVLTVEGGGAPAISRFDGYGRRVSRSPLPIPVGTLSVVAMDDGEHAFGVDLQRRSVVAVHAAAHGKKAQLLDAGTEIATLRDARGHVEVGFTSGASAEICADGNGTFHWLGWSAS